MDHIQRQIILKVYLDSNHQRTAEVPITPETTCKDVIECCKEPGEEICHLAELWRGIERPVADHEKPFEILQQWGIHRDEVHFYLRHEPAVPPHLQARLENLGRRNRRRNGVREVTADNGLPSGVDLTLSELQEMATRQQQQIETQQQMLVAKEQRLKFLKQQELKHQQIASENEKLRKLREKVEVQELKLKKLRALRGQVEQHRHSNGNLMSELEAIKSVFNEKEKELSLAVNKVEDLTRQLEEVKRGKVNGGNGDGTTNKSTAVLELEKLRKELMIRNKLNEQQSSKLTLYRETLAKRKDENSFLDNRIEELQQRLKRKRAQQQQQNVNKSSGTGVQGTNKFMGRQLNSNVAAVEPYIKHTPKDVTKDDMFSEDLKPFAPNKNDPKYQTLPYNLRFPGSETKQENDEGKTSDQANKKEFGKVTDSKPGAPTKEAMKPTDDNVPKIVTGPQKPISSVPQHMNKPYAPTFSSTSSLGGNKSISIIRGQPEGLTTNEQSPSLSELGSSRDQIYTSTPVTATPTTAGSTAPYATQPSVGTTATTTVSTPTRPPQERVFSGPVPQRPPLEQNRGPVPFRRPGDTDPSIRNQAPPPFYQGGPVRGVAPPHPQAPQPRLPTQPNDNRQTTTSSSGPNTNGKGYDNKQIAPQQSKQILDNRNGGGDQRYDQKPLPSRTFYSAQEVPPRTSVPGYGQQPAGVAPSDHTVTSTMPAVVRSSVTTSPATSLTGNKPTYRYAPKSVIANTYMKKLGTDALDNYRKNMAQLYKDFYPKKKEEGESKTNEWQQQQPATASGQAGKSASTLQPGSPTAKVRPLNYPPNTEDSNRQQGLQPPKGYSHTTEGIPGEARPLSPSKFAAFGGPSQPHFLHIDKMGRHHQRTRRRSSSESSVEEVPAKQASPFYHPEKTSAHQQQQPLEQGTGNGYSYPPHPPTLAEEAPPTPVSAQPEGTEVQTKSQTSSVFLRKKTNLKTGKSVKNSRRVSFDPLALLLDASLEGELDLVKRVTKEVPNPSQPNDEGITALHNAICAGHYEIVTFLVEYGADVNSPDSDGWTPLHCAASCNNLPMVKFLVEHGACIFATTISDHETAAEKCEEDEDGYDGCSEYLYSVQEKLGILNSGVVFALFEYEAHNPDELSFKPGDKLTVLRKGDENEKEWWWAKLGDKEGYIPRNLFGFYPRVTPQREFAELQDA
ncbi:apoptosis-stimulating of p53 protein 1 isoform X2 [Lingula anatina]|uniref:Apoptosis-stimulating of p53 protein 1 isoform X2 n=1 Tax=Lingula anatina TaxID=7574 RepID=A0A1S3K0B8_LINAN|nr:apoptosis-stimulating of p53 protein 1 isoform X2 [Lingula anatina]|eukprot:XP_013416078.1 apoptosis-stimulating of p53 protein 1 isoform X2 [Lingula anatina]